METKTDKVRRLVSSGDYKQALQICKEWQYRDPSHREILRLGYECLLYPDFYKQLGYDPNQEYQEAIKVLHIVYGE
jgi:hypothetical protein